MGILSLNRPILILDEPFNGLDLETNSVLKQIILLLKAKNKTILITSHILETLTSICDEIHYLKAGAIQRTFTPETYTDLEAVFSTWQEGDLQTLVNEL